MSNKTAVAMEEPEEDFLSKYRAVLVGKDDSYGYQILREFLGNVRGAGGDMTLHRTFMSGDPPVLDLYLPKGNTPANFGFDEWLEDLFVKQQ